MLTRSRQHRFGLPATCAVALCVATAAAQPRDVTPNGRLLDANPAVGGSGLNYSRPVSPIMMGNNIATGNVRGGFGLRSFSPISNPNQFQGPLGSSRLSGFIRDSVSVSDAGRPLTERFGTPFIDPQVTAPTVGYLRSQGLSQSRSDLGVRRSNLPGQLDYSGSTFGQLDFREPLRDDFEAREAPWELSSSMFAATPLEPPDLDELSRMNEPAWISEFRRPLTQSALGRMTDTTAENPTPFLPLDYRLPVASLEDEQTLAIDAAIQQDPLALLARRADQLDLPEPTGEAGERESLFVDPSLVPGQSVFNDMQLALSLEDDPSAEWFSDLREAILSDPGMAEDIQERASEESDAFVERMLDAPLRTFAGEGDDPSNLALLRAEALMHSGDYYDAAHEYDKAALYDRNNPLPLVGKGHALLASGDYRSAAAALLRGLEMYPSLARFRVDLTALIGGGEIVDIRRSDLMKLLERNEDPRLRFLLGYLELHTGRRDSGIANLEQAADDAEFGSFIQRYPQLLRQGRRSAE